MFRYNCFVEFSPEYMDIIGVLVKLGYKSCFPKMEIGEYLVCEKDIDGYPMFYFTEVPPSGDYVDCGDNMQLFIEVCAISDENDYLQVFILDNGFVRDDGSFFLTGERFICTKQKLPEFYKAHKATLEEIIEFYS